MSGSPDDDEPTDANPAVQGTNPSGGDCTPDENGSPVNRPASVRGKLWTVFRGWWAAESPAGAWVLIAAVVVGSLLAIFGMVIAGSKIGKDVALIEGSPPAASPADFVVILGYGLAVISGTRLACRVVHDSHVNRWARFGYFCAWITVFADCVETVFTMSGLIGAASVSALVKVSAALPSVATAAVGIGLTVFRLFSVQSKHKHDGAKLQDRHMRRARPLLQDELPVSGSSERGDRARWRRGYCVPEEVDDPDVKGGPIGICLSGGGIRAASVMLGVLQAPRLREDVLPSAAYLVSVSGGGYTAGAFQQALTGAWAPEAEAKGKVCDDPTKAFLEGSAEEDHVRRHASYLADNPAELLVALGLLASHLILTLTVLFGPAIVLGVIAGSFYRLVPVTQFDDNVSAWYDDAAPSFPAITPSALWALGVMAGLAALSWLGSQFAAAHEKAGWRDRLARTAPLLSRVTVTVAVVTVVLPAIIWTSAWILHQTRGSLSIGASPIAAVLLTYAASLASLLWRKRSKLKVGSGGAGVPAAAPRGVVQLILVIAALAVLAVGWLLLFGGTALTVLKETDSLTIWTAIFLLVVLVVLGGFVDETTLSLHPFYRRRLASAFAVRAVERDDGAVVAVPYQPTERTTLSTYGELADAAKGRFPKVVFAASATLGDKRTPPGSNRVSYTFSGDWVGGPDIGYIRTEQLEKCSPPRLKRDLTVQGAVALSGAALAASTGAQNTSWYETLFAVSGVRLGAWMPNPMFLIGQAARADQNGAGRRSWYEPGLPRVRRLSYLLRELIGIHPANGPLLQVTDGGFYDSLGLIELFRRRCTRIYCIDASGDNPPPAATLAGVLTLAYQELGVEVILNSTAFENTPGTGTPTQPADALTALNPRLAKTGILTASFTYPEESDRSGQAAEGKLVVAKASLWPDLPYPLLAYAANNPTFPNDSTADQWFDDNQYAAYTALGRELGEAAVIEMGKLESPTPTNGRKSTTAAGAAPDGRS